MQFLLKSKVIHAASGKRISEAKDSTKASVKTCPASLAVQSSVTETRGHPAHREELTLSPPGTASMYPSCPSANRELRTVRRHQYLPKTLNSQNSHWDSFLLPHWCGSSSIDPYPSNACSPQAARSPLNIPCARRRSETEVQEVSLALVLTGLSRKVKVQSVSALLAFHLMLPSAELTVH